MAQGMESEAIAALRAASFRVSSTTDAKQIPIVAASISNTLQRCRSLFAKKPDTQRKNTEVAVVLNKWLAIVSSLLNARSPEERWSGVVLAKATLEASSPDQIEALGTWTRNLLSILKKNDPPTTKILCIATLTKLFTLTWAYPSLVREITTPALPSFIQASIACAESGRRTEPELVSVLESFSTLLPHHPTVFRTHQDRIAKLIASVIPVQGHRPEQVYASSSTKSAAARLWTRLCHCEPRQGAASKWQQIFASMMTMVHAAADRAFYILDDERAEADLKTISRDYERCRRSKGQGSVIEIIVPSMQELTDLLLVLETQLSTESPPDIRVPVGPLTDLTGRLLSISVNFAPGLTRSSGTPFKDDSTKEEQDAVSVGFPSIHRAVLQLVSVLAQRFGNSTSSILPFLTEQVAYFNSIDTTDVAQRAALYDTLRMLVDAIGPQIKIDEVQGLALIVKTCCKDVSPDEGSNTSDNTGMLKQNLTNGDKVENIAQRAASRTGDGQQTGLQLAARRLRTTLISRLPHDGTPSSLRAQMDRAAILTRDSDYLVASTLNPPAKGRSNGQSSSLLYILARTCPADPRTEAILRPRMPLIKVTLSDETNGATQNGHFEDERLSFEVPESIEESTPHIQLSSAVEDATMVDHLSIPQESTKRRIEHDDQESAKRPRSDPVIQSAETDPEMEPILDELRSIGHSMVETHDFAAATLAEKERRYTADKGKQRAASYELEGRPGVPIRDSASATPGAEIKEELAHSKEEEKPAQALKREEVPVQAPKIETEQDEDDDDENFVIPVLDLHDSSEDEEDP